MLNLLHVRLDKSAAPARVAFPKLGKYGTLAAAVLFIAGVIAPPFGEIFAQIVAVIALVAKATDGGREFGRKDSGATEFDGIFDHAELAITVLTAVFAFVTIVAASTASTTTASAAAATTVRDIGFLMTAPFGSVVIVSRAILGRLFNEVSLECQFNRANNANTATTNDHHHHCNRNS